MMQYKDYIIDFKENFEISPIISTVEISKFFSQKQPGLSVNAIRCHIHHLVEKGVLQRVGRGKYRIGTRKNYYVQIDEDCEKIARSVRGHFPLVDFCIWDTAELNHLSHYQSNRHSIVIDVENGCEEAVWLFLKDANQRVFLKPSTQIVEDYMFMDDKVPLVIERLNSESPMTKLGDYNIPTIEKMLVDIVANPRLFYQYQGDGLRDIINNAFDQYAINVSKLVRYASRRGKKDTILQLLP